MARPWEAQSLSALARQLTPQAKERGFVVVRVHFPSAVVLSVALSATFAAPAVAGETGGVAAGASVPRVRVSPTRTAPAKRHRAPTAPPGAAPVTSRSTSIAYTGPVFQKAATGAVIPYVAPMPAGQVGAITGGSPVGTIADVKPELLVPGSIARYVNGIAAAPLAAPAAVQQMIWAGDQIIGLPYVFGGGHASFTASGYDCSGTVSFALHGAGLLSTPEDSSELEAFSSRGIGRWVTIFSNPGHAYMTVAGLRLDTSAADDPTNQQGPRWRPLRQANDGYVVRHPLGL
jgi:cell wall-associated NlpC family hydrolase